MQIKAEMAGTVLDIKVKVGDKVTAGQEVAVIESMKMEVGISASQSGVVAEIFKNAGDFINAGDKLLEIK